MKKFVGCSRALAAMTLVIAALSAVMVSGSPSALAQEISQSHIAAAKKAISTTGATAKLNDILPNAAVRLIGQLISTRPDIEAEITQIVNETALELAPRRGDLEKEAAKIYSRIFSEQDLLKISEFFATEAGQKFLAELPIVVREIDRASRIWGTGINRDLAQKVQEKLKAAGLQ